MREAEQCQAGVAELLEFETLPWEVTELGTEMAEVRTEGWW